MTPFAVHLGHDRMPETQLIAPLRSGEIEDEIRAQVRRHTQGLPTITRREMDVLVEMLNEARDREQKIMVDIERRSAEQREQTVRKHVEGRDRRKLHSVTDDGPLPS